ncbi:MAG TPA: alkaline phosphatase D family protein [Actinomycetes bacterium]|jgi:alkaline phosphatase D
MTVTARRVLDRRRFLAAGGAAAALLVAERLAGAWPAPARPLGYPFTLGVASGDPAPGGVVLWTRLAPAPRQPDGGMPARVVPVDWQVAADPGLGRIVRSGTVLARPGLAHAVHVEVDRLEPARTYWYRFRAGGEVSPVGRTRTLPAAGASPARLALAVVSCQHFEHGYYTAYQHLAQEDLDLVMHLGDYLYETAPAEGQPRRHAGPEPIDLVGYRQRHAQYRTDPDLQAAHAAVPFVLTWDDHEVDNDYAGDRSERFDPPGAFRRRRAAAYRAYWEHLPLRRRSRPRGPAARMYRRLHFGDLAELAVLDTRQYRDDQPCDDNGVGRAQVVAGCRERLDPRRTLLGTEQRRWLLAGLAHSGARWNVIAQQLLMAELDLQPGPGLAYNNDGWDGYAGDRDRILRFLRARRPSNPIVLGGDLHSFWVNDLKLDNHRPDAATLASEFVGTSVSSSGPPYEPLRAQLADNPHVRFFDSRWRGYLRCLVNRRRWVTDLRVVDTVERPGAPVRTLASFEVPDGRPGPQRL